jgi:hypothetical protein
MSNNDAVSLLKRIQPYLNDWDFPLGLADDVVAFLLFESGSGNDKEAPIIDWEVDDDSVSALDLYSLGAGKDD